MLRLETMMHRGVDPAWDAFVERVPGGSYQQSSRWLQVKATVGWSGLRVILRGDDGQVIAGCQLLLRRWTRAAAVAFAPRAPLGLAEDPQLTAQVLEAVEGAAARERIRFLKLQPAAHGAELGPELERRGYAASELEAAPTATVVVDLDRPLAELEAAMRTNARRNVGRCRQRGVRVRAGVTDDLPTLLRLFDATARRQAFPAYPHRYYQELWRAFSPGGRVRMLLAEHEGRALAGQLAIAHGDTVSYVMGGRCDDGGNLRPNELLHLTAMAWGRELGLARYDLNGVDLPASATDEGAEAATAGGTGVTHFKLGLGGKVLRYPGAYDRVMAPFGPVLTRWVAPRLHRLWPVAQRALGRGRSG